MTAALQEQEDVELLVLGPLAGLDPTTAPYEVAPPHFPDGENIVPALNYGGFSTVLGRRNAFSSNLPGTPTGGYVWHRQGLPDIYLFAVTVGGAGKIYAALLGGTPFELPLPQTIARQLTLGTLPGANVGHPSVTVAVGPTRVSTVQATQTASATINCTPRLHKPTPDPDTWFVTWLCNAGSHQNVTWTQDVTLAPINAGTELTFHTDSGMTISPDGTVVNLDLIAPDGVTVLASFAGISAGNDYSYFNAGAVVGTYTWRASIDISGLVPDPDGSTAGTYSATITPTTSLAIGAGGTTTTQGANTVLQTPATTVAPTALASQLSLALSSVVTPSDANGTTQYNVSLTDSSGKVWQTWGNITAAQTLTFFNPTALLGGVWTWTVWATVAPTGVASEVFNCSCTLLASWYTLQAVLTPGPPLTPNLYTVFASLDKWCFLTNGADTPLKIDMLLNVTQWGLVEPATAPSLTPGATGLLSGTYNYCTTFGTADQESSQGGVSAPITVTGNPQSAMIAIGGTPGVGDKISVYTASGGLLCTYTVVNGFTSLAQVASALAALINAQPGFAGTAQVSANVITWSLPFSPALAPFSFYCTATGGTTVSPTTLTPMSGGTVGEQVVLSAIPVSNDPQVTQRNIYRIGGALGQWRLVGTLADNTSTTFTDNLADSAVIGQSLTVFRDPPPPFTAISSHQGRIVGFGTKANPSQVWISNYNEPWGFNSNTGILVADYAGFGDGAVACRSIGTVLVLLKQRSTYTLWGSTDADFDVFFNFNIGCDSPGSVDVDEGIIRWKSRRGVYMFDGYSKQNLSDGTFQKSNIKSVLDALSPTDSARCAGFHHDRGYGLSVPALGKSFFYDTRSQAWWRLGFATPLAISDPENIVDVVAVHNENVGEVDQWFAQGGDLDGSLIAYVTSRRTDCGSIRTTKSFTRARLEAPQGPVGSKATVTVTANPGALNPPQSDGTSTSQVGMQEVFSEPVALDGSTGGGLNVQQWALPDRMVGFDVQMTLLVDVTVQTYIGKLTLFGQIKRSLKETG